MLAREKQSLVILFSIILVILSVSVYPFNTISNQHDLIARKYSKIQTSTDSNTCTVKGDDINGNLNCANINPQTLGKKNLVDVDNLQSSIINEHEGERGPPGPQGPPGEQGPPGPGLIQDLVHVVWRDQTTGNSEILYIRDGFGFDPSTTNLSNNEEFSAFPAIATSGEKVYVVWQESLSGNSEILYRRSIDGGATFSPTINLSNDVEFSDKPAVAASGENVYIVWRGASGPGEIFYKRSADGGITFGATEILSMSGSNNPKVAVSGENVYVVWQEFLSGNSEILYRRSIDGGATFSPAENLSNNSGGSHSPVISATDNSVYIIWHDFTPGNEEILYRRSIDGGATFSPVEILSNDGRDSFDPAIDVSGENVHVVWTNGELDSSREGDEIIYSRSTDLGATFSPILTNLSNNNGESHQPDIAVSKIIQ